MPVAAPTDKRFRRARATPTRTPTWRAALPRLARLVVLISAGVFAVYAVASQALSAEALTVTRISVSGNARMSRGEVVALLDGIQGANMLTADLEAWRQKLLHAPWVAEAAIRRVFPGTVAVAIVERQPMGIARVNGDLYLVDAGGTIIDQFGPNYTDIDLPIIDGLAGHGSNGLLVDAGRASLAGRLLADIQRRPDLARRVSQIDVSDAHDATLVLDRDSALVRVGDDRFLDRLQAYLDLAPALRERVPDIEYVDLRFDERVYVRPHGRTDKPRKGAGG